MVLSETGKIASLARDSIFIGSFIRIGSLVEDFRYPPREEAIRRSAIGRIGKVAAPTETSDNDLATRDGLLKIDYTFLTKDGVQSYGVYVADDFEPVAATEDMVLLYSDDLWQLLRPYGELQDTPTFARLVKAFGMVDLEPGT